ncbi:hypothetical protein H5410_045987 [Solanum commersonii]|uniref:Uncharacterized protein n=1 Tax=Solanum commersonii TaxID=4109 RepID=A0A9J5XB22_SOLCO|nr:hypothetical protein H5410_045987 [Solanum commersonii]
MKVESIAYANESSKNDSISKKDKSVEPFDGMNDLWEPLNKLVTKGDTLDNSKDPIPKFINSIPLMNLDDYENEATMMMKKTMRMCLRQKLRNTKLANKMFLKKLDVVQAIEAPSSSNNKNIDK